MDAILIFFEIIVGILALANLVIILVKPIRERVFNTERSKEGERCLLRSEMLRLYYHNEEKGIIRQFELENFIKCYEAYKALGGNSFIDEINAEVRKWRIVN